MRRRSGRLGKRNITVAATRNRILPAPGFLPMEDGMEVMLNPTVNTLDYVPQQLISRPARPGSGSLPITSDARPTLWLRAAYGPSIN
jgi:hypothetical protein